MSWPQTDSQNLVFKTEILPPTSTTLITTDTTSYRPVVEGTRPELRQWEDLTLEAAGEWVAKGGLDFRGWPTGRRQIYDR